MRSLHYVTTTDCTPTLVLLSIFSEFSVDESYFGERLKLTLGFATIDFSCYNLANVYRFLGFPSLSTVLLTRLSLFYAEAYFIMDLSLNFWLLLKFSSVWFISESSSLESVSWLIDDGIGISS